MRGCSENAGFVVYPPACVCADALGASVNCRGGGIGGNAGAVAVGR